MIGGDGATKIGRPGTTGLKMTISGVGEKKQAEYGEQFISEIAAYLAEKE